MRPAATYPRMAAVDFDRQAIERRDFPVGRRGYDPAAVDAHLRALAAEFEELQRAAAGGNSNASLASTAGSQVQSILEAAETAAGDIERGAQDSARQVRDTANRDAERTRDEALEKARAQVAAVAGTATSLLERVGSMDAEVNALVASLRAGAGRLAADLAAVEAGMGDLYGAAAAGSAAAQAQQAPPPPVQPSPPLQPPPPVQAPFETQLSSAIGPPEAEPLEEPLTGGELGAAGTDLDGARLIALNMALNGESRADTERYLAENFQLPDRLKLIDEVYAAIEG
jgi:DivIVA domain-containing protein